MRSDLKKVRANVEAASTDDLLDRATVWRDGMEPEALDLIEAELRDRGFGPEDLLRHGRRRAGEVIIGRDGNVRVCHLCHRPAVEEPRQWWRLCGLLPVFPRTVGVCEFHRQSGQPIQDRSVVIPDEGKKTSVDLPEPDGGKSTGISTRQE
jgi:hypothetical protein